MATPSRRGAPATHGSPFALFAPGQCDIDFTAWRWHWLVTLLSLGRKEIQVSGGNMSVRLVAAAVLCVGVAACSSSNSGSGGGGGKKKYTESYDYTFNGCPTKRHEFSSDNAEDVRRQL